MLFFSVLFLNNYENIIGLFVDVNSENVIVIVGI